LIDEIIWNGGGMMLSANYVINEPWKHATTETGTTPYNASVCLFNERTCVIVNQENELWIVIVIILVRNVMICMCS
jgi:hypothetical protein